MSDVSDKETYENFNDEDYDYEETSHEAKRNCFGYSLFIAAAMVFISLTVACIFGAFVKSEHWLNFSFVATGFGLFSYFFIMSLHDPKHLGGNPKAIKMWPLITGSVLISVPYFRYSFPKGVTVILIFSFGCMVCYFMCFRDDSSKGCCLCMKPWTITNENEALEDTEVSLGNFSSPKTASGNQVYPEPDDQNKNSDEGKGNNHEAKRNCFGYSLFIMAAMIFISLIVACIFGAMGDISDWFNYSAVATGFGLFSYFVIMSLHDPKHLGGNPDVIKMWPLITGSFLISIPFWESSFFEGLVPLLILLFGSMLCYFICFRDDSSKDCCLCMKPWTITNEAPENVEV